jgi:hypothetical protein
VKVKIRVAVAVDEAGNWNSCGWGGPKSPPAYSEQMDIAVDGVDAGEARYWLEAEVDLPSGAKPIDAVVVREGDNA